eukprot:TRINITY_DN15998_c0_g1::TRINITY_DN15998_c0_g1_i1::g.3841::m.3841 TRINITY_DN15998_c0_g1::TRINITY_DN15998_c0_g1_i1::g.3841  ORF type:complete len:265 (-),score=41.15,sp/Q9C6B3/GCA2_ARATH/25.53/4e-17,Hexapep/PF00132.19/1.2e+02,Hexapep/PF00132.19/12,Hexapep/PF00132.19/8.4,Hexapep/PF00132.19/1.1e-06,Hexapep_2/PF14602.1/8.9,Hexapep_2/PF14602.1/2.3,Fucokinase/PF07959.7/3.5e+02,Fucokinase/PF07959.7/0.65 TRINITY_DN15998_c0_g1_i1:40-795(-)
MAARIAFRLVRNYATVSERVATKAKELSKVTNGIGAANLAGSFSTRRPRMSMQWGTPVFENMSFVSQSCDVVGAVRVSEQASIMANCVLKGNDVNVIWIGSKVHIRENCVLSVKRTPTPNEELWLQINPQAQIGPGCVLDSCVIGARAQLGANCVISEGCLIGNGAIILDNTFLPPGTVVPDKQVWGGKPGAYVRDVDHDEEDDQALAPDRMWEIAQMQKAELDYYEVGSAYQHKEQVFPPEKTFLPFSWR